MLKAANRLIKIAFIKNLAQNVGVKRILLNANYCNIYLYKIPEILPGKMAESLSTRKNGVLKFEDVPIISFDMGMAEVDYKLDFLLNFFKESI